MGVFIKAVNLMLLVFPVSLIADAGGLHLFSEALFTPFGALFFFLVFLNELSLIYL